METVAYCHRGLAKYALNQFKEAIADYNIAIYLNPKYSRAYVNRSIANIALEDYETAIQDCDEALHINPLNADAFEVRGTAKIKLEDTISGNEDLDKARQLRARWEGGVPNSSPRNILFRSLVNHAKSNNSG